MGSKRGSRIVKSCNMELRQKILETEMCGRKSKIMIYDQEILLLAIFLPVLKTWNMEHNMQFEHQSFIYSANNY